ncbi:MAG: hypothetical protein RH982_10450 [Parvibaculum sp.]
MALIYRDSFRKFGLSLSAALLIAGCTVVEGGQSADDAPAKNEAQLAAEANKAAATANDALATGGIASVASANIPLPLPSPLRRDPVQVASIDPSAGVSSMTAAPTASQLAGVYVEFGSALAAVDESRLNTPSDIRRALAALRFDKPDALANGWYVTHAMIAAQDPLFSKGIREEVRARGKEAVLAALKSDDNYVLQISGVSSASAAVAVALRGQSERMAALSARFIDTAYSFQKQKWGMTAPMPGAAPETKAADATSVIDKARAVLAAMSPVGTAHAYTPSLMNRILTLAAYQVMDGSMAEGASEARTPTGRCLNWARLNLDQCIAAARFPSEEAWCTGKHGVEDVRGCWAEALPPSAPVAN